MKSRYVCTRSANVGDIKRNKALIRVLGYVISDSGKYSGFRYPDIRVPVEITSSSLSDRTHKQSPSVRSQTLHIDCHLRGLEPLAGFWEKVGGLPQLFLACCPSLICFHAGLPDFRSG